MRDAQPVLMGVSPRWAELSQSGKPAWKSHSSTTRKKPELRTIRASPTVASAKPEPWCSDAVRPRLSSCWDVATGAHVCAAGAGAEKEMGGGAEMKRSFSDCGALRFLVVSWYGLCWWWILPKAVRTHPADFPACWFCACAGLQAPTVMKQEKGMLGPAPSRAELLNGLQTKHWKFLFYTTLSKKSQTLAFC